MLEKNDTHTERQKNYDGKKNKGQQQKQQEQQQNKAAIIF